MGPHVRPLFGRLAVAAVILLGVALFALSLSFDAVRYEVCSKSSMEMLALGWMGPMILHVGWYANLGLPFAWILALILKRPVAVFAIAFGAGTLLLGLTSFYTLSEFSMMGRNEGEMAGDLLAFLPGIYLWTASLATGVLAGVVSLVFAQLALAKKDASGT